MNFSHIYTFTESCGWACFFFIVIIYLVIFYLIFTEYAVVDTGHEFLTEKKKGFHNFP